MHPLHNCHPYLRITYFSCASGLLRISQTVSEIGPNEHLNLGEDCLATGYSVFLNRVTWNHSATEMLVLLLSVSMNNIKVLSREEEWHRHKVKETIYTLNNSPVMNCDHGYQLHPSTTKSFCRYLCQVTDNQCVIKARRSGLKLRHSVQKLAFKVYYHYDILVYKHGISCIHHGWATWIHQESVDMFYLWCLKHCTLSEDSPWASYQPGSGKTTSLSATKDRRHQQKC